MAQWDEAMLKRSVKGLREQLQQEHELDFTPQISALREESSADENTLFSVSVLMVKSGDPAHVREGLANLEKLSFKIVKTVTSECAEKLGFPANDVGCDDQDKKLVQCLYFIALAKYKQGAHEECVGCCDKILRVAPDSLQVRTLHCLATEARDDISPLVGIGVAAGGILLAAAAARLLVKR
eukprot:Rhum_TRINITY_DN4877_c0_g1::Rhum_TRINITY_DN4877_c0_g1_i1::g.15872::m.15872